MGEANLPNMRENLNDVLIVGGGIAGAFAARRLHEAGLRVAIIEKSRGIGGRMSFREGADGIAWDHGAQYLTTNDPRFTEYVLHYCNEKLLKIWFDSLSNTDSPRPRYIGVKGMSALARSLTAPVKVHLLSQVERIVRDGQRWQVYLESGRTMESRALLLTPPAPQVVDLLSRSNECTDANWFQRLAEVRYAPCLALLLKVDPGDSPGPQGFLRPTDPEPIAWIADNLHKGVSSVPSWTIHSGPEFAFEHLDTRESLVINLLLEQAASLAAFHCRSAQLHRWKYALCQNGLVENCLGDEKRSIWIAGDAFGSPRIEGAALSGITASEEIRNFLA